MGLVELPSPESDRAGSGYGDLGNGGQDYPGCVAGTKKSGCRDKLGESEN